METIATSLVGADTANDGNRQKHALSALHFLNKLDPSFHSHLLPDLRIIFHAIDVTIFLSRITDWLQSEFSREESREIVRNSLQRWTTLPIQFEVMKSSGWTITCRSGASKEALGIDTKEKKPVRDGHDSNNDCDNDDAIISDSEDEAPENYIEAVQAITDDGEVDGMILATIHEGDEVLLNSHSSVWWTVYEMRPKIGIVLLVRERKTSLASRRPPHKQDTNENSIDENGIERNLGDSATKTTNEEGSTSIQQHNNYTITYRILKEYKEVKREQLIGAMVKRVGYLTAETYESLERDAECEFSGSLLSSEKYEEYRISKPAPSSSRSKTDKTYEDKSVVVLFQLPCPSMSDCVKRLQTLVKEFPKRDHSLDTKGVEISAATVRDPVWHMQHQAQVKEHVIRWEHQRRAKEILKNIDPYISMHRKEWLLVCRLLRCISRGGDALLRDFITWTKAAGKDGERRAKDCRPAWASVRVRTLSDLPALAAARGYLKAKGAGYKRVYFDNLGKLRPEATEADPQARDVLDAAILHLDGRVFSFFDQNLQNPIKLSNVSNDIESNTLLVPSAIYTHDGMLSVTKMDEISSSSSLVSSSSHQIGTLVETKMLPCYIAVQDILLVREPVGDISIISQDSNPQRWVQVIAIDILFARLQVVSCSVSPPHCWLPDHQENTKANPSFWIPASKLWDVTVTRLLPPSSPECLIRNECQYQIFVTPMPTPEESLALLAQLSSTYPVMKLDEKRREVFKVYNPVISVNSSPQKQSKKKQGRNDMIKGGENAIEKEGQLCRIAGKLSILPLRFYTDAVIISWDLELDNARGSTGYRNTNKVGAKNQQPDYSLFISDVYNPRVWAKVYEGSGIACQISGLESAREYRCRLVLNNFSNVNRAYIVIATLASPPTLAPYIRCWENASVPGNVRGLVEFEGNNVHLPPGCQIQIEGSLGPKDNNDDGNDAGIEDNFVPLARTCAKSTWIVGPFKGKSLILRCRYVSSCLHCLSALINSAF